ncbi:hypothetical protein EK904_005851, partial [Melospiza melodia maxima]
MHRQVAVELGPGVDAEPPGSGVHHVGDAQAAQLRLVASNVSHIKVWPDFIHVPCGSRRRSSSRDGVPVLLPLSGIPLEALLILGRRKSWLHKESQAILKDYQKESGGIWLGEEDLASGVICT